MKHRLSALLDGMEMTRSEHDWLKQRFDNMTAKEELLFRGAVGIEHPEIINGLAMSFTPPGTVDKQHIGSLRSADLQSLKMLFDIITGIVYIFCQHLTKLINPLISFWLVSPQQRMHGKHVHAVVMTQRRLLLHTLSNPRIINNMIASYQTCQIEGL